ncbi:MAG: efflux RND transporter periplasmic adaptor subunit [Ignavibacteriae bacterium]|nr:efflux RND transporter periplasmic adaptor subunit [Ignavibacteriota bacterium]NOG98390.1 efflux RND transporter periplasmic adaptor subunit [Ignavibacteriota bacterium]
MKNKIIKALIILMTSSLIISCGNGEHESKSMEQIYKEEGVPVKVSKIEKESFSSNLTYNTVLSGIKESSASAMIGGRIENVLVKVGDYVEKDQLLVTFPTDNPATQYYQAKVAYENALSMYERYKSLFETGGISAQELDNIKTQFEVNKANWNSVKKTVKVLAPISGYVTKVAVNESDNVRKETQLVTVADLSRLKASINVSENEIDEITKGTQAEAHWLGKTIQGKVTQVDMAMDPYTQAFNADVVFDNSDRKLMAGLTVEVNIKGSTQENTISVERKNLVKKGNEFYAFVVNNSAAKQRKLILGKNRGLFVEVVQGLNENDLLITEGQMFLEDNSKIKIINGESI